MTNHNVPPAEDHEAPMTFEERTERVRAASADIILTRPLAVGRNQMGDVVITEWLTPDGLVKCQLSTPIDGRSNKFFRLEAHLVDEPKARPSVYVYDEGPRVSISRRISFGENLEVMDEIELLLRACPLNESHNPEDVGPENPKISEWQHGNET